MDNKNPVKILIIYPGVLFGMLLLLFAGNFFQDIEVNSPAYAQTSCVVVGKKVVRSGVKSSAYYPMLQLGYVINKQPYTSWTPTSRARSFYFWEEFFLDNTRTRLMDGQQSLPIGSIIPCWYKASDPKTVFTEKGYHVREAIILLVAFYNWMMLVVIGVWASRQHHAMGNEMNGRVATPKPKPFYITCMSILSAISIVVLIYAIFGM